MELWIRSQDKELLVLAKGFEFQHVSYDGSYQIFAVWQNNYHMVGKYKNKKRALEVLDEIQNIIKPKVLLKEYDNITDFNVFGKEIKLIPTKTEITQLESYVYEMPEE